MKINHHTVDDIWEYHSNILLLINTYQNDFREDNTTLIDKEKEIRLLIRKEKLNIIIDDLRIFCKIQWKTLIIKAINEIRNEINNRKTKGMLFGDVLRQVDKIEEDLIDVNDIVLNEFENIYFSDIKPLREDTKDRIDIENYNYRERKKNIFYNIVIAIIFFVLGLFFQKYFL